MLLVHGFTDYFFNTELADHFAARGFAFYALDLHKCGRSWREGQTPHFTTDLARYDAELERALDVIAAAHRRGEGAGVRAFRRRTDRLAVAGPAAAPRRHRAGVASPAWCSTARGWICRARRSCAPRDGAAIGAVSRLRKKRVVRPPTEGGYGTTLHRDYGGEFDYDLTWKPIGGFPVTFGWIHAIRRGAGPAAPRARRRCAEPDPAVGPQRARGHRPRQVDEIQRGDAVLDVKQIARWAGCIGNRTTIVPIADAKHDVFLSVPEPRQAAYRELDQWLDWYRGRNRRRGNSIRTRMTPMAHFDIAIIGTGSGNSILDERYADKRVAICEQGVFGGTCLNVGCIPTKMFVYAAEVAQTVRDSARYGVDAHVDGVRWSDIVSRVFGRIDPIALGGENYRRSSPNVEVFASHTRFGPPQPDGRYALRTDDGDEFTADQVVIAAGSRAVVPDAIADCGVPLPHQRHHHADRRCCPSTWSSSAAVSSPASSPTSSRRSAAA